MMISGVSAVMTAILRKKVKLNLIMMVALGTVLVSGMFPPP